MEKNMTMQMNENMEISFNEVVACASNYITASFNKKWNAITEKMEHKVTPIAKFYSKIMEEEITPAHTLHILNAQAAFLGILLTAASPLVCAGCVAWFAAALKGAKRFATEAL